LKNPKYLSGFLYLLLVAKFENAIRIENCPAVTDPFGFGLNKKPDIFKIDLKEKKS